MTQSEDAKRQQAAWILALKLTIRQATELLDASGVEASLAMDPADLFTPRADPVRTIEFVVDEPEAATAALAAAAWQQIGTHAVVKNGIQILLSRSRRTSGPEFVPFLPELPTHRDSRTVVFHGLELRILPDVYEPRPDTSGFPTVAVDFLRTVVNPCVVDVGTGSGAIALAIARARPDARVIGTDVSSVAIETARENAERLGIGNAEFLEGSLFDPLPASVRGNVDVVAANLPYVAPITVALYELASGEWLGPLRSVLGEDADGLGLVRRLIREVPAVLRPDGLLILDVEAAQIEQLSTELSADYDAEMGEESPRVRARLKASAARPSL